MDRVKQKQKPLAGLLRGERMLRQPDVSFDILDLRTLIATAAAKAVHAVFVARRLHHSRRGTDSEQRR